MLDTMLIWKSRGNAHASTTRRTHRKPATRFSVIASGILIEFVKQLVSLIQRLVLDGANKKVKAFKKSEKLLDFVNVVCVILKSRNTVQSSSSIRVCIAVRSSSTLITSFLFLRAAVTNVTI